MVLLAMEIQVGSLNGNGNPILINSNKAMVGALLELHNGHFGQTISQ